MPIAQKIWFYGFILFGQNNSFDVNGLFFKRKKNRLVWHTFVCPKSLKIEFIQKQKLTHFNLTLSTVCRE